MTLLSAGPAGASRTRRATIVGIALGSFFLVLALACSLCFAADVIARRPALRLLEGLSSGVRPATSRAMGLQESADLASAVVATEILGQPVTPEAEGVLTGEKERDAELARVRDVVLVAVTRRPGRAYSRFLLARVGHGLSRGSPPSSTTEQWMVPARLAAEGAPGIDGSWEWLADRCLENWPRLSAAQRDSALPVLQRAFLDPVFVDQAFAAACAVVPEKAVSLLPDDGEVLRNALESARLHGLDGQMAALGVRLRRLESVTPSRP